MTHCSSRRGRLARAVLSSLLAGLLLAPILHAQEGITRTVPIVPVTIASYVPKELHLQKLPVPRITVIILHVASGVSESFSYPCAPPCAYSTDAQVDGLINALNTADLKARSLWRRTFDRLLLDFPGRFVGGATVQ